MFEMYFNSIRYILLGISQEIYWYDVKCFEFQLTYGEVF